LDWGNWHSQKPFASLEQPDNNIAHTVYEYDEPDISIIIPVGPKHAHLLVDALDSIEAQTYRNWEAVIVFDDGSTKNEYYEKAYPYCTFIYTSGGLGAGKARNLGVQEAQGKYITFLDCDDYLQPRFLELTKSALEHFEADWIYTDLYAQLWIGKDTLQQKIANRHIKDTYTVLVTKDDNQEIVHHYEVGEWDIDKLWHSGLAGVTCLYKKTDFDAVGGFDELYNREDLDLHLRLAKSGKCGLRVPIPLFTYRQQAGYRRLYKLEDGIDSEVAKKADIARLRKTYNLEELKMACPNCGKKKIKLTAVAPGDLLTLEYTGMTKMSSAVFKGVTGKKYGMSNGVLTRVHPTDAVVFIQKGLFKQARGAKPQKMIVAPVSKPVVVKRISRGKKIKQLNDALMKATKKARQEADAQTARMMTPKVEPVPDDLEQSDWISAPENYSLRELKERTGNNKAIDWASIRENEAMGKARKTVIAWIDGKLKKEKRDD